MREPANASATSAGTCAFIAQVRSSLAGRAELAAGHEHHVGELRQRLDLLAVEQVGRDAFDAGGGELSRRPGSLKRATPTTRLPRRGALGEPRQRRTDLAADAEDDEVAASAPNSAVSARRRRRHHLFEVRDVAEAVR